MASTFLQRIYEAMTMRSFAITALAALSWTAVVAQTTTVPPKIDDDGTLHQQNGWTIPYSNLASDKARQEFVESQRNLRTWGAAIAKGETLQGESKIQQGRRLLDKHRMVPQLARLRDLFSVEIVPETIGGVQTDIVLPKEGVAPQNRNRVLINLHGGGFQMAARYGGQQESVPIAVLGRIRVVTVDYRMGPEHKFPAASEDVASVYRELLKEYSPGSIGIYGCSAGGMLTAQAAAWFQEHALPPPGAIAISGAGGLVAMRGDSNYIAALLTGGAPESSNPKSFLPYFDVPELDLDSALVSPALNSDVLRKFPPTLLLTGTRDMGLSPVVFTHSRLVDLGVEAHLHVFEGAQHCSFAQPKGDPNVPENWQAWKVIVGFFNARLGR